MYVNRVEAPKRAVIVTFDEYVRLRGPALVRLAWLIAGDRHRGEDLVQEVLTKAYPRWGRILAGGQPDVYLRRMLINADLSWRRRRSSSESTGGVGQVDVADPTDIEAVTAERDAVWRMIVALPPKQRATIVLRFYEDLDDSAIAEILGCSPVTVRTHTMRALGTLRQRLDVYREDVR